MADDEMQPIGTWPGLLFTDIRPCDMTAPEVTPTKVLVSIKAPNIDGGSTNLHGGLFSRDEVARLIASLEEALEGVAP